MWILSDREHRRLLLCCELGAYIRKLQEAGAAYAWTISVPTTSIRTQYCAYPFGALSWTVPCSWESAKVRRRLSSIGDWFNF